MANEGTGAASGAAGSGAGMGDGTGAAGAGATGAAAGGGNGSSAAGAAGNTGATDWTSGFNEDLKGYVTNKGFKAPDAMVESYRNLEKFHGTPVERLAKIPERSDDAEGWKALHTKLGMPEKADDYAIPAPKEGTPDENFVKAARGMFHEAGLTKSQAEKLGTKWNEYVQATTKAQIEAGQVRATAEQADLKKEWGMAFEQNVKLGEAAAVKFGVGVEELNAMEATLGYAKTLKFFHNLGARLGVEPDFTSGGKGSGGFGNILSPAQALAKINSLSKDPEWTAKWKAGGVEQMEEWTRLHEFANPQKQVS